MRPKDLGMVALPAGLMLVLAGGLRLVYGGTEVAPVPASTTSAPSAPNEPAPRAAAERLRYRVDLREGTVSQMPTAVPAADSASTPTEAAGAAPGAPPVKLRLSLPGVETAGEGAAQEFTIDVPADLERFDVTVADATNPTPAA